MAINPYTLYGLYEKGILDYVPSELLMPTPSVPMTSMSNPYLDLAKQGGLYQKYGSGDSYTFSGSTNTNIQNTEIGSHSHAGVNAYGLQGIGAQSMAGANAYGLQGIGTQNQAGGTNAWGGFSDAKNQIQSGFQTVTGISDKTPKFVKGLLSALIIGGTALFLLKRGKKPQNPGTGNNNSFLSKLNPVNWYKAIKTRFSK